MDEFQVVQRSDELGIESEVSETGEKLIYAAERGCAWGVAVVGFVGGDGIGPAERLNR
ncbi:MAG: hypothetical protein JHD00_12435 [Akkermansiaceae bacterium]|nr:hypothetical protein [Akkermansiaceae bacterium]MBJ7285895.1 hypothetical protein [Akkermansiaceae bacterium]